MFGLLLGIEASTAALLLRIAIGVVFMFHAFPKLGAGRKHKMEAVESLGSQGWLVTFAGLINLFGGVALILGIFTSVVAVLSALWMVATLWWCKAKLKKSFVSGYDLNITLLLASIALLVLGGGAFSLDNLLRI